MATKLDQKMLQGSAQSAAVLLNEMTQSLKLKKLLKHSNEFEGLINQSELECLANSIAVIAVIDVSATTSSYSM